MSFHIENKLNWLYIDINSYFATIEQQVTPDLRNKPVAIVPLLSDSTCATAASYEAKLKGITTGTRIYQAKKLCPELICVKARNESTQLTFEAFGKQQKHQKLSKVIDTINKKMGINKVCIGITAKEHSFQQVVAFGHIPNTGNQVILY